MMHKRAPEGIESREAGQKREREPNAAKPRQNYQSQLVVVEPGTRVPAFVFTISHVYNGSMV